MVTGANDVRAMSAADRAAARSLARDMDRLTMLTTRLQVDQQRFLVGDLPMPPLELRHEAQNLARRLRERVKSVAEQFRLRSLEAKLNSQLERFGREVRKREQSHKNVAPARTGPRPDPREGVVIGAKASAAAEQALYEALYPVQADRRPTVDLDRFRAHLRRNVEIIQAKTGCRDVCFRIAVEDGKTKLKAKPIRTAD